MSDNARADNGGEGTPPEQESQEAESWLREAVRAPHAAPMPNPGDVIGGKYTIEALLGRGGMGAVFRARHVVSEKPVAIKWMLRPATDDTARKRFEREARAAGRIDHPNVVTLYDIGEEGDCSYLVMELLRGESLRARLSRGHLSPTEAVETLIPAMRGVAAAHRAGVVHRDLKPDNIFLCDQAEGGAREAKVLDFGISSIVSMESADSTLTQEGTLLGSLSYMSPEQLTDPHEVDARADVYAFGVILYEALTGSLPFRGASHSAVAVAIITAKPERPSQARADIPKGLEDVILHALERDRAMRYPGMNSLIDALLPFRENAAAHAVPAAAVVAAPPAAGPAAALPSAVGTSTMLRRSRTPRSRLALAAAASLLVLAALWAFSSLRDVDAEKLATPVRATVPPPAPTSAASDSAPTPPPPREAAAAPSPPSALPNPSENATKQRVAHSTSLPRSARPPVKSKADPKEDALFSGRK